MASKQSKIQWNVRKKRSTKLKEKQSLAEKENTPTKTELVDSNMGTTWGGKCPDNIGGSPSGAAKKHHVRKLLSDSEDENSPSPPKHGRKQPGCDRTPSQLLSRVSLGSPRDHAPGATREHRLSPKKLFAEGSQFQRARRALHGSAPESLPARRAQLDELRGFLLARLEARSPGMLYVSGPPGTGKTACLASLLRDPQVKSSFQTVYINCTSMKTPNLIYSRICEELGVRITGKNERDLQTAIEKFLSSNKKMTLLVLDEIDQLDSRKQSVLYTVFEWPTLPGARLVLVGVANALDLTDRVLPRLQARVGARPQLLRFEPYSKAQLVEILVDRLRQHGADKLFPDTALQLLAGKVASVSGDVRRALDIARRVVDIAETQSRARELPLQPTTDGTWNGVRSPHKSPEKCMVSLNEVLSVLNGVYGTAQKLDDGKDSETFPLQQKVVVCSLILMLKKGRNKDIVAGKLHEVYRRVCAKRNLLALDQSEFLGLCQLVESRGILRLQTRMHPRLAKVSLQWDEEEVCSALGDKQLLASILSDTSCLVA
ncbi:cell division control protein 6 homolog [Bacillus rossius redtenbacheri]|uniref:cell division control protein 6 homolog n=1 Tax=Bacillus rossius redtenbacheri TaxID=93214 RepID=UPI002FDD1365